MNLSSILSEARRAQLDAAAMKFLQWQGVEQPPVPIEDIMRNPAAELWRPDLFDLSLQSFESHERYAARPTIARLVARYAGSTPWARQSGLTGEAGFTMEESRYFGRALLMPKDWIDALQPSERNPASVRLRFHVPGSDAAERLAELFLTHTGSDR